MNRRSEIVTTRAASIETYVDGSGPAVVVIPSYGRDGGEDFDPLSAALVDAGYRVLRPQPRGIARSAGPMTGVGFDDMAHDIAAVILAAASGKTVAPEVNTAPMRAGDLSLPDDERLAALRLAFFAPGQDASIWLAGWYPDTLAMQVDCVQHADVARYRGADSAPVFEIIAALDPFHRRDEWADPRTSYGERITSTVIADASHALFPEQPDAVSAAIVGYLRK
jgi:pimeloyl-ACP methyl ester carboxylesterase